MSISAALLLAATLNWTPSTIHPTPSALARSVEARSVEARAVEARSVDARAARSHRRRASTVRLAIDADALQRHVGPSPELSLEETIHCVCRGLQRNDDPYEV